MGLYRRHGTYCNGQIEVKPSGATCSFASIVAFRLFEGESGFIQSKTYSYGFREMPESMGDDTEALEMSSHSPHASEISRFSGQKEEGSGN